MVFLVPPPEKAEQLIQNQHRALQVCHGGSSHKKSPPPPGKDSKASRPSPDPRVTESQILPLLNHRIVMKGCKRPRLGHQVQPPHSSRVSSNALPARKHLGPKPLCCLGWMPLLHPGTSGPAGTTSAGEGESSHLATEPWAAAITHSM